MKAFFKNPYAVYLLKFAGVFAVLYYGYIVMFGLITPGNYHSSFLQEYFRGFDWFAGLLLAGVRGIIYLMGFESSFESASQLRIVGGASVTVAPPCLGMGVLSFWTAFVAAGNLSLRRGLQWWATGCVVISFVNMMRITMVLLAAQSHTSLPFGLKHHTVFTVGAYGGVFLLMFFYDRSVRRSQAASHPVAVPVM